MTGSAGVYFAGDTDLFEEMSALAGSVDLALLPVAGWGPTPGPGHLDPARAVQAAARITPRVVVPIHWGTLAIALPAFGVHDPQRPAREFAALMARDLPALRGAGPHTRRAHRAATQRPDWYRPPSGRAVRAVADPIETGEAPRARRRQRPVARIIVVWLLSTGSILVLSELLSGVNVTSFGAAFGAAAVIGLINALVWPIVLWFALPLTVMTLGLGVVALNGAIVLLAAAVEPGSSKSLGPGSRWRPG